ncbi:MAG TPA: hypothetical protein VHN14_02295, partial [Kofleriaceae bacterium]|nr:hypothetical protein [Kofleriaceae bacterium]
SAGVFRSTGTEQPVLGRAELNEIVANRAAIAGYTQILAAEQAPKSWRQQVLWGKQRWLGYVLIGSGITGGIAMVMNVRDPDTLDLVHPRKLAATIGATPLDVRVTCDSIERHALPPTGGAWLCHIGTRILPMVGLAEVPASGVVHGTLVPRHPFHPTRAWEQWLERDEGVNLQTYEVFLDTTLRSKLGQIVLGGTVLLATLGLLVLWERERRHRARLLAGARSGMATTR